MTDPTDIKTMPGFDSAASNYSTMTKSMQSFASEMQRMSKDTMDQTTQMVEKLRGARSIEEAVSIQSGFMQQSFSNYADFTRRFSEMMMSVPMELMKNNRAAVQQSTDAMSKAGEEAAARMQQFGQKS